jgi:hypothetical protein
MLAPYGFTQCEQYLRPTTPLRGFAVQWNPAKSAFTRLHQQSYDWRHINPFVMLELMF